MRRLISSIRFRSRTVLAVVRSEAPTMTGTRLFTAAIVVSTTASNSRSSR
ncbi:Uncharacterised protein [Mycobacteroides abscessus subsp. abscessus]|nr:Uncharacterised protein [Mycobacteroides abscessus subsp. abscessus]